jgi:hypothetical protein
MAIAQLAVIPALTVRAQAPVTIAQWTFDGDVTTPSTGAGTAALVGGTTAAFVTGFPASPSRGWNTSNYPAQGTNSRTAGAQFTVSTVGFTNITFSFDERHSSTAANTVAVQYSTDGLNFVDAQAFVMPGSDTWAARLVDLSAISALNNQPSVVLRIVSSFADGGSTYAATNATSTYASGGTIRLDNVTISGIAGGPPPGDAAPSVTGIVPANGATNVATGANIDVTFSEPVNASASSFTIACATSGAVAFALSGGPTTFTLDPATDFAASEACTVTVIAAQVTDQDANDPPDNMAADFVSGFTVAAPPPPACSLPSVTIGSVQGTTDVSPVAGQTVSVQGVVIGDYEFPGSGSTSNFLRGFYVQDAGDGNPDSSDGIFVFNGNNNSVSAGQVVRVTGVAAEFQGQTQIGNVTSIEQCGTTGTVTPTDVSLPFSALDFPERFEGMLVRLPQTLYVSEHFQLGRFGQIVMSSGDRLRIPTQLAAPGAPALAIQAANNLNRIIVDDTVNIQNPDPIVFGGGTSPLAANNTLRIGDTAAGIVGVMTYGWAGNAASPNAYRVRPNAPPTFTAPFVAANPRPASPADVGGTLKVASTNVLNYFNTFGRNACTLGVQGGPTDCRGAENQAEFDRQIVKIVAMLVGTGADIMAMSELENDGYGPASAIADLVNRLNAATAPGTYAYIDADAGTGQVDALGDDAIKVGLIYKPAKVMPVGNTAALNTGAFGQIITQTVLPNGTISSGSIQRNRPALAQTFEQLLNAERITVVANHLKSKGSGCADNFSPIPSDPDLGDGAGNCNLTRKIAAQEMAAWLATNPTGIATPNVLITGDLNSYAKEDPITAILNAGYTNLIEQYLGPNAYSFVFGAQSGYLDHALASPLLAAQVTGVAEWHVNADEPNVLDYNLNFKSAGQQVSLFAPDAYRSSDHDPLIVGLKLNTPPVIAGENQSYIEDQPLALQGLAVIDPNPNDTISVKIVVDQAYGSLSTGTAGSTTSTYDPVAGVYQVSGPLAEVNALLAALIYTPFPNCFDVIPLTITANDGHGPDVTRVIELIGIAVNDAPIARDDAATAYAGVPLQIAGSKLIANDTDPDGDGIGVHSVSATSAQGGVVTFAGNQVTYTPPSGFTGNDAFTYVVSDGNGGEATGTVNVSVKPLPAQTKPVQPILECVKQVGATDYVAYFGYRNPNSAPAIIAVGSNNQFAPAPADRGQTTVFYTGRKSFTFNVTFSGSLAWTLDGVTVTASAASPKCK